jgi:hypothetical protein
MERGKKKTKKKKAVICLIKSQAPNSCELHSPGMLGGVGL